MSVKVTEEMYQRDRAQRAGYIGSDVSRKPGWLNAMASEQRGGERKSVNSQCQMAARHANSVALVDELSLRRDRRHPCAAQHARRVLSLGLLLDPNPPSSRCGVLNAAYSSTILSATTGT